VFAWSLAGASVALAASYDPELRWRTITTEHFHIHFHQGEERLADELSVQVEATFATLTEEVGWSPRGRVHVVLVDRTDSANGFASVIPYNQIVMYATAPGADSSLGLYEDWSTALFTHELTHILHIDTNHGVVRAARTLLGRVATTHQASPRWIVEGYATFEETRQSTGGRGRAAGAEMVKRTAALQGDFPPLGNLDGFQPDPPAGNLRYLFGQDFIQWVADHQGENAWTRWVHLYGGHLPFLLPTKGAFGRSLQSMYRDWKADEIADAQAVAARVAAEGETLSRVVSDPDSSCIAPSFSPDGNHLVFSCYDSRTGSAIWRADGDGYAPVVELDRRGASQFTWRADSNAFVYAGVHVVNQFNTWSDVYLHVLGEPGTTSLTSGARARDPDFSPDGSRLLVVTNKAQDTQIERLTVDRRREALTRRTDHAVYATPRHSPSGKVLATSIWQDGQRDLYLLDADAQPLRRLTLDASIEADPTWSADGRWLYFSSDRNGIPNIYAVDLTTERLWQVTNVTTGATKPTVRPDGRLIAWQQYSADGWEVRAMPLDPATFLDRGLLPHPPRADAPLAALPIEPAPARSEDALAWTGTPLRRAPRRAPTALGLAQAPPEGLDSFDDADVEAVFGEEADYPFQTPPHRYNPLPGLLPRYVLPWFQTTPHAPAGIWEPTCLEELGLCGGVVANLATHAADPLRHAAWAVNGSYRTDAEAGGLAGSFTWNRYLPVLSIGGSTLPVASAILSFVDPEAPTDENGDLVISGTDPPSIYFERRNAGWASLSFPYRLRSTLFGRYALTERRELDPLPDDVYLPLVPLRGTTGALSFGWRYAKSEQTPYAISVENGRVTGVVASLLAPWLGTFVRAEDGSLQPLTQIQLTGDLREYVVNPWVPNHVIAVQAGTGIAVGGTQYLGSYQLGGSFGDNAFYVTPDEFRMLRGYPFGYDAGDLYWLTTLEYRAPLWRIQRGWGTVPVFVRDLSVAGFVDAGNAFVNPAAGTGLPLTLSALGTEAFGEPLVGTGAELTLRTVLLWGAGLHARGGVAVPLTQIEPQAVPYLQFGGSF
jgi:Tol biopolymer transport system component